ncbi:type II secretion system protein E [Acetobacter estunensis NRIC 0472]|uniref:CpaF family protein n=1 Tax=Acetobacter estunensis TaxID=104097 RepID=A0A967EDI8_9PROT|nr:CpaF family protein [Acetobacter estunensis]NHO54336.1 CpaF family protein [Acetobacter estunensis]GBQ21277.1 type II secretion system protein E [Acetobacter estunensis NRIC 0472]
MTISPSFGKKTSNRPDIHFDSDIVHPAHKEMIVQWTELHGLCLERLDPIAVSKLSSERLIPEIERVVNEIANEKRVQLNAREQKLLANELVNDINGLGPIQPLLDDDKITDIMVNGPYKNFIEKYGKLADSGIKFRDRRHLIAVSQRIASGVGRRVDESSPTVDARLEDGSRVNIVFPPLALDGPYLSIRKFSRRKIDFKQLVENGSCSVKVAKLLEIASRIRLNVIISGGTGSGKTTLMNAMSRLIDPGERIITVEDAAELQFQQPHVVRLETRPPSIEGNGEITQRDLVRNALRMRPDRIIIGEVRGAEAFDMLQAMNTGHDGSMSTIHANTTRDALTRIENMVQMGNFGLSAGAIRTQIVGAVDLIVQIERQRDGVRRIVQITDVSGIEGDVVTLNDVISFSMDGEGYDGKIQGHYNVSKSRPSFYESLVGYQLDKAWNNTLNE